MNIIIVILLALLSGCYQVEVVPINPATGEPRAKWKDGVRYFLPKPYLLVTMVPVDPSRLTLSESEQMDPNKMQQPRNQDPGKENKDPNKPSPGTKAEGPTPDTASSLSIPVSNTSFGMATKQYGIKLIYLPDFSQPMAVRIWGAFGSSQLKPTLQDGWMLTSLDASSDTKTPETIGAIAELITAASNAAKSGASGGTAPLLGQQGAALPGILLPGLYEFEYDDTTGKMKGVKPVMLFGCLDLKCDKKPEAPSKPAKLPNAQTPSERQ